MTQDDVPKSLREDDVRILDENEFSDDDFEMMELVETLDADSFNPGAEVEVSEGEGEEGEEERLRPDRNDAILSFDKHTGSIFACALSPDGKLAATGGEDDMFYLWNSQTGEVIHRSADFTDSVTMVQFSNDGKYVAAADMLGRVIVWKIVDEKVTEVYSEAIGMIFWIKWHPQIHVLLLGSSMLWMVKIPSGQYKCFQNQDVSSDVGVFMPDGKRAAVGYDEGSVRVVDLVTGGQICKFPATSTKMDSILCLAIHPDNDIIAAGSVSSKIAIFKTQPPKFLGSIDCFEHTSPERVGDDEVNTSVESIAFGGEDTQLNLLVAGTDNALHVIDYRKMIKRHFITVEEGLTRFIWPEGSLYVYVATKRGNVNIYCPLSGGQMKSLTGHSMSILDINYSKISQMLITGGDDHSSKIFKMGDEKAVSTNEE